jgi:hypothetical protein
MEAMTARERWLAALDMKPVDRLPFWPKLFPAYLRAQAAPFSAMALSAIHDWVGSDKHISTGSCVRTRHTASSLEVETKDHERREVFKTPSGSLERISRFDEDSQSWHPVKMPVQSAADIPIMAEWYGDATAELDREALAKRREERASIGEGAVVATYIGGSPLMNWVEHIAGVENGHYLLVDRREEVEALFEVMHRQLLARTEVATQYDPADLFYLPEDTSTTLISPEQFRTYCLRHIGEYAGIARSGGRRLALHMCGHLRDILPDLATLPVSAFEAFSSPPVGNARLLDARTHCPNVCLVGGTNATLWMRLVPEIIAELERDLDALPHHRGIVVTSGGVMPPAAKPETIRAVCEWVKQYPARMTP